MDGSRSPVPRAMSKPCPDFNRFTPAYFETREHRDFFDSSCEIEDSLSRVKSQAETGCKTCLVIYEGFLLCGGYDGLRALNARFESMRVEGRVLAIGSAIICIKGENIVQGYQTILIHSEFNICSVEGMSYANCDAAQRQS